MSTLEAARTALRWYDDPSARPNPYALAVALRAMVAAEDARLRDLEHPESTPESVTDEAFNSQAAWWVPGDKPIAAVLIPELIEEVAAASYAATLKHLQGPRADVDRLRIAAQDAAAILRVDRPIAKEDARRALGILSSVLKGGEES